MCIHIPNHQNRSVTTLKHISSFILIKCLYKMEIKNFECLHLPGGWPVFPMGPKRVASSAKLFIWCLLHFPRQKPPARSSGTFFVFLLSIPIISFPEEHRDGEQDDRQETDCWTGFFHSCPLTRGKQRKRKRHTAFYNPMSHSLQKQAEIKGPSDFIWVQFDSRCCMISGVLRFLLRASEWRLPLL